MRKRTAGFTLIELSIVLVIIGLIIGGVLVGRDLIHAAEIRATVSQFEKYNAAANTFRSKYNCLPGDCTDPTQFGGSVASGNGDGIIGSTSHVFLANPYENAYFFEHLLNAGLINDAFALSGGVLGALGDVTPKAKIVSPVKLFGSGGWGVVADAYFDATYGGGGFPAHSLVLGTPTTDIYFAQGYGYLPSDMSAVDKKIDDGLPTSGSVRAYIINWDAGPGGGPYFYQFGCQMHGSCVYPPTAPGVNNGSCITNSTPPQYNIPFQYTNFFTVSGLCSAIIKASF